jgi:hypothetical protein
MSCSRSEQSESIADGTEANAPVPALAIANPSRISPSEPNRPAAKLIKTAGYRMRVESVASTTKHLEHSMAEFNAYISSSKLTHEYNSIENHMIIRVPNVSFDSLLRYIDNLAVNVILRNVSTEDVTKDFVDLESRLKTKRELEGRYMEILRKKAGTIEELLAAEKQIGELHEEIEATISRINFLKDQVSYSTINLEYFEPLPQEVVTEKSDLLADVGDAFRSGMNGTLIFIIGLIHIWPVILIVSGVLLYLRFRRKRIQTVQ